MVGSSSGSAFVWNETDGMTAIGPGSALGVSADGSVVAVSNAAGAHYLWYAEGTTVPLPDMTRVSGFSDDGLVAPGADVIEYPDPGDNENVAVLFDVTLDRIVRLSGPVYTRPRWRPPCRPTAALPSAIRTARVPSSR